MSTRTVRLTVHPGLGKTATSTVQGVLRGRQGEDLWYGGIRSHDGSHPFTRAYDALLREPLDRTTWRARIPLERRTERLAALIADGLRRSPTGVGVLSNESLLAHVGDAVGWRGPAAAPRRPQGPGDAVAHERLDRLSAVLARTRELLSADGIGLEVRGLLTIRRHSRLLASTWAWNHDHYRRIGVRTEDDLLRLVAEDRFPRLRFSQLVERMEAAGLRPTTVLPLEALARDPDRFWREVSEVVGHPIAPPAISGVANRRRTGADGWLIRTVANPLAARTGLSATISGLLAPLPAPVRHRAERVLSPRSTDGGTLRIDPEVLELVDRAYADDSGRVGASCPFDLRDLGYPVSDQPDPVAYSRDR